MIYQLSCVFLILIGIIRRYRNFLLLILYTHHTLSYIPYERVFVYFTNNLVVVHLISPGYIEHEKLIHAICLNKEENYIFFCRPTVFYSMF